MSGHDYSTALYQVMMATAKLQSEEMDTESIEAQTTNQLTQILYDIYKIANDKLEEDSQFANPDNHDEYIDPTSKNAQQKIEEAQTRYQQDSTKFQMAENALSTEVQKTETQVQQDAEAQKQIVEFATMSVNDLLNYAGQLLAGTLG